MNSRDMESFFFQEPNDDHLKLSSKIGPKKYNEKVSVIAVPFQSAAVVLMNHPTSHCLYKYVSVTVLSGTVSINGYELNKKSTPVKVFSSEKTGLIELKTETYESIWKKKTSALNLERELTSIFNSDDFSKRVLQRFENSTVAVYVKRCPLPCNIQFVEFYCPQAFEFNLCKRDAYKECFRLHQNKTKCLQFGMEEEKLASELTVLVRNAKLTDSNNPRVLVCGPRNTGKSVLLQYLINKILSEYQCAFYLDTDPGQPEFTPPGVVSLSKVMNPILGPPFFHQKKNAKMMFTGDISPSFLDLYSQNICKLMEQYMAEDTDEPLFVNTMGWMEGTGLQCLLKIIDIVKPTVLVEIVDADETSMFDYRNYLSPDSQYFQLCYKRERKSMLSPKEMRDLTLLSHLGKCQPSFLKPLRINQFKSYCVSWDKIPLYIFPGRNILSSRMVQAVNESIVALCCVPKTTILESKIPEFPKTLEIEPENECLAYGLVQAVDETEHLLYIISPLMEQEWTKVNAIIKGNVMVPDGLMLQQETCGFLPYTDRQEPSSDDEEFLDIAMVSLQYLSENEMELTTNLDVFSPHENFRKPVKKRHCHRFSNKRFRK